MSAIQVVVGTTNPGKIQAVQGVFATLYPGCEVRGIHAPSGVPDQPIGVAQTRRGAINRARAALKEPGASWGLGLEGGVRFVGQDEAWLFGIAAAGKQGARGIYTARSAELLLPVHVAHRIRAGEELGPVMDDLLGTTDIKKGMGTVGAFTLGLVTRPQVWQQAVSLAIAPLLTPELYAGR